MPAPTVDLLTVTVSPTESSTTEADFEAGINAALASGYNQAVAGLNAGTIAPLVMGGTSNVMTGALPPALADTSIYSGRAVRFIPPGGNTLPPTIEIGGVVFSIRDMHGRELPAGALTNRRYIGIVTSIGPTPVAQIWLIAPIQMADIPGLAETVMRQRGPVAAGGNINLLIEPGIHFLAANGGYTGLPPDFNTTSAAWLEVVNYGGEGGQGSGRFVLQTLTSMATVLPGGPGHVYRPTFQRRHDSLTPDAPSNMAAWGPIHAITPLAGKRVVCLGDSITQGGGPWDWPAMLAGLTGATVVNGGFGGCRMGVHSMPLFDPFSMYRVSERIRYGDWSVLTAAADALYVGTGDDRRPAAARLAALDWSQVTHIVIGYGTNDFGGDVPMGSDGDTTGATFKGALNMAVQNILTAYPSIQILIQTPLWRSRVYVSGDDSNVTPNGLGLYLRDYAQAIRDRAAAYQLPVCDLHTSAGINPVNAAAMMPDGLHPWSTAGVERVAMIVAGSLLSASGGGGGAVDTSGLEDVLDQRTVGRVVDTVAELLGPMVTYAAYPAGTTIQVRQGGWAYRVAAAGATDHHLTSTGGAKLYVIPILGAWVPPEQLGYTSAAANWGAVAQIAWNAGFTLLLGRREYLTSSTAYIRSRTGVIGHGDRVSGVKAVDGFAGNVIDTEGYATLRSTGAIANALGIAVGVLLQPVLKDFYIDGNRPGAAPGTDVTGIGVRVYCRMPSIHNLRVVNCAAHGVETALAGGNPDPFVSLDHSRIGVVSGLSIMECGREGWIFRGPADIPCDRVFIGNNGKAGAGVYDALNRTTSLVFPGETCDGLVLDNVGAEFANGHVWNHQHGRGIRIRTDASGVRARFFNMISEGNWGQVHIDSGARVEFYGEIHGNDGGPRNERVFYDAVNVAGSAFAVGQTLTGVTSGAVGTITSIEERTATSGLIIVSFETDALREVRYQDNERVTNGTRQVTVYRPDYYGAVPWWRDDSMQGNLVSLKVFQTGLNDGGTMLRIGGQNHVYTVQAQSSTPRFGHGIDLYGDNVTISGYMEGRARTAPNGQASAGLIVRAGAERANIDLTIRSCQQNVLFEDNCADSRISVTSVDPLADHFNGVGLLTPAALFRGRLVSVVAGAVVAELGAVVATPAEIRSGSGNGVVTPAGLAAAAAPVSLGATVSGDVLLDPLNPATGGINMVAWVAGPTVFRSPANLPALSGTLRVRMLAAVEVHFDRSILRDEDMPLLTPDPRCWLDTVYGWDVIDGHLRLWTHMPVKALVDAPTLNAFGAAWDPGAGLGLVTDGSGAVASVGDPVRYLPPVVQNRAYLNAAGGTSTVGVTDMVLDTAAADGAPPVLIERDGRQALMGNAGGTGLEATMAGFGSLGLPNPAASPNAMPFYTRLTMMQMLYLPVGMGGGCPMSAYRADTAQTAQMGLMLNAAGLAWGYGRFSAGAVPQVSSAAAVAGNTAVHAAEMDAELGRWLLVALQIRITGTIETVEDTAPPGTTQRGAGATWEMWVDDGVGEFGAHAITTFSSYRGSAGFRPNRFRLFALGNNGSAVSPIGAASGRVLATVDDTLVPGSPAWRAWARWVGGL